MVATVILKLSRYPTPAKFFLTSGEIWKGCVPYHVKWLISPGSRIFCSVSGPDSLNPDLVLVILLNPGSSPLLYPDPTRIRTRIQIKIFYEKNVKKKNTTENSFFKPYIYVILNPYEGRSDSSYLKFIFFLF
jgi:hypothetical protein